MKQEKLVQYNLRLPDKLKAKAEKHARQDKRSLNKFIVLAVETYLQEISQLEKNFQKTA